MLKSILALIVSCALIGGTGAVPATPAAETRTVIENIVFSAGGDSVALDHALEFTAAAGSDAAEIGFELDKAGESILPMKAKITPEEFVFSIAEGGNAYSVSDEFIAEYFGGDTEDIAALTTMAEIIGALPQ
ncbi:MAG: hypothetical protein IJA26_06695, partial [Clostridia bacterium]|nr:hypothetical protein [Clostridia bacterium]